MSDMHKLVTTGDDCLHAGFVSREVFDFALGMQSKLNENAKKGESWRELNVETLFMRLVEETGEIGAARLSTYVPFIHRCTNVENECYDVANFAMFLAEAVKKERRAN